MSEEYGTGYQLGYDDGYNDDWLKQRPSDWGRDKWRGYRKGVSAGWRASNADAGIIDNADDLYAYAMVQNSPEYEY